MPQGEPEPEYEPEYENVEFDDDGRMPAIFRAVRSDGGHLLGNVMTGLGEIIEGKPPRQYQEAEAPDDDDLGLKFRFDPDDPQGSTIRIS